MTLAGCALRTVATAAFVALTAVVDQAGAQVLEGQPNFRDLGGYETSDGRVLREGLVYRSGELPRLKDDDVEKLEDLGVKTVVNFLTEFEIESRGEDRLPEGVREINLPITGDVNGIPDSANMLVEARRTGDFRSFPPEFNPMVHEQLVSGMADAQYTALFEILSDEANYPVVFHCSHGVHRTGTAAALILTALGVPWEMVREDYLLSNETRAVEVGPRIVQLNELADRIEMTSVERAENSAAIDAFYLLEPQYIDGSRTEAEKRYGSVAAYIESALGQSTSDLNILRFILLE